ncbi:hypothetical protein L596_030449 [Steinernema carpocapsae]|uniref:Uncharacterized protein n=1 Tax=Steinernema carpocapsae TaxID=34508 RepID=A0A4U5LPE9_STECR|nr:hypothetical protein L596_030449 [Steinernema carpocapsae]
MSLGEWLCAFQVIQHAEETRIRDILQNRAEPCARHPSAIENDRKLSDAREASALIFSALKTWGAFRQWMCNSVEAQGTLTLVHLTGTQTVVGLRTSLIRKDDWRDKKKDPNFEEEKA